MSIPIYASSELVQRLIASYRASKEISSELAAANQHIKIQFAMMRAAGEMYDEGDPESMKGLCDFYTKVIEHLDQMRNALQTKTDLERQIYHLIAEHEEE